MVRCHANCDLMAGPDAFVGDIVEVRGDGWHRMTDGLGATTLVHAQELEKVEHVKTEFK